MNDDMILVIDDDFSFNVILVCMLECCGYFVCGVFDVVLVCELVC